jgi:hypothetical protein
MRARAPISLQRLIGSYDRAPHVGDWAAIVTQSFFWLLEVPANDIEERVDRYHHARIKRVQIVHRTMRGSMYQRCLRTIR